MIDTGYFQTAKPLNKGDKRGSIGISTGIHLEEASYYKVPKDNIEETTDPSKKVPVKRPLVLNPDIISILDLSTLAIHFDVGVFDRTELNTSIWGGLYGIGGRVGFKYNIYNYSNKLYISIVPEYLMMTTNGGSSPEEKQEDGQQRYFQHVINDKKVYGFDFPIFLSYQINEMLGFYVVPNYSFYKVDISKAFYSNLIGEYYVHKYGISFGTSFKIDTGFFRPEISLILLDFNNEELTPNVNFAIGWGFEE